MAQFTIYFTQTASTKVDVEAESLDDAIDVAYNELPHGLCAHCSGMGYGNGPGIDLSGDWEPDEKHYGFNGEYVEAPKS